MKKDISFLRKNTFYTVQIGILAKLLGFISQYLLIHWLSTEAYGEYTYLISIVGLVSIFLQMGLRTYILKLFSSKYNLKEHEYSLGIFTKIIKIELGMLLPLFLIYELFVYLFVADNVYIYQLLGLMFLFNPVFSLLQIFLQAMKKIVTFKLVSDLYLITFTIIAIGIFFYIIDGTTSHALELRIFLLFCCTLVMIFYIYHKLTGKEIKKQEPTAKEIFKISLPMVFAGAMTVITNKTDIIMLGSLSSYENVAVYNMAFLLAQLSIFGLQSSNAVVAPLISQYYHKGETDNLKKIVALGSFISSLFALAVFIFLIFAGKLILGLINEEFVIGSTVMFILLFGFVVNASFGPVGYILTMTSKQNIYLYILSLSAVINIFLNNLLIPIYGINGAAIATMSSMLLWNIASALYVYKNFSISTFGLQPIKVYEGYKLFRGKENT